MKSRVVASAHFNKIASSEIALVSVSVVYYIPSFGVHDCSVHQFSAVFPSRIAFLVSILVSRTDTKMVFVALCLKQLGGAQATPSVAEIS